MPRSRPSLLALAAVCVGVCAMAPYAYARTELGAVNVLAGSGPGYLEVRLPSPVAIDAGFKENRSLSVEGSGRVVGIVLRRLAARRVEEAVLAAGRFDPGIYCRPPCSSPVDGVSVIGIGIELPGDGPWVLPAGDYRVYLVTDGGPGQVTLRLPELVGKRELNPTVRTGTQTAVLSARHGTQAINARTYGGVGELSTDGVIFETHMLYYGLHANTDYWTCYYWGEPSNPLAYLPGCPTDSEQYGQAVWFQHGLVNPAPGASAGVGLLRPDGPGTFGVGGTMTSASTMTSAGWAAAWIDFESAATPAGAPPPSSAPPNTQAAGRAVVSGRRLTVRRGRAAIALRCAGDGGSRCSGTARLSNGRAARFDLAAGERRRIGVPVPARLVRALKRRRAIRAELAIAEAGAVHTRSVTLRSTHAARQAP